MDKHDENNSYIYIFVCFTISFYFYPEVFGNTESRLMHRDPFSSRRVILTEYLLFLCLLVYIKKKKYVFYMNCYYRKIFGDTIGINRTYIVQIDLAQLSKTSCFRREKRKRFFLKSFKKKIAGLIM